MQNFNSQFRRKSLLEEHQVRKYWKEEYKSFYRKEKESKQ